MTSRIKIVPDTEPNAEGEWVEVPLDLSGRWKGMEALVAPYIPAGHHVVAVERGAVASRNVTPIA